MLQRCLTPIEGGANIVFNVLLSRGLNHRVKVLLCQKLSLIYLVWLGPSSAFIPPLVACNFSGKLD